MKRLIKMQSLSTLQFVLILYLMVFAVSGQETLYGMRMPNLSSTGPMESTGTTGGSGFSSVSGPSTSGPSGASGAGRIVSNSILDLEETDWPSVVPTRNENIQLGLRQQSPGLSPDMMVRPIITGPSVASGQMLVTDSGGNSMSMEDRSRTSGTSGSTSTSNSIRPISQSGNANSNAVSSMTAARNVYRYVSVHVPPPEPMLPPRQRPAQPTLPQETHYQIVFIKAPSPSPQELQEIQLPPPPKTKTLVYVLLKKPEMNDFVKINQPPKVKPSKPEVFFIRYKGEKPQEQQQQLQQQQQQQQLQQQQQQQQLQQQQPQQLQQQQQQRPQGSMITMTSITSNGNINGGLNSSNGISNQVSRPRSTSTTTRPSSTASIGLLQNAAGGYGSSEISDSDFSHDSFNENEYSLSSYQQRHNINQQQERSRYSYSPVGARYGIIR